MTDWLQQFRELRAGRRRSVLIHADCLDVGRRLPDGICDSVVIDPPYGMSYQGKGNKRPAIANDQRPFVWWLHDAYRALGPTGALACFCQWRTQNEWRTAIKLAGFDIRSHVVWDRELHGMGHPACTFAPQHDVVWFATKGKFQFPHGRPSSVMRFRNVPAAQRLHSTQKPDALMRELVHRLTPDGGIVYDPCMGSGSTGAAAVATGYRFIGVEMDDHNFEVAQQPHSRCNSHEGEAGCADSLHPNQDGRCMTRTATTVVRPTESEARKLEEQAGYIVAELSDEGASNPIDSGTWEHCCAVAKDQAERARGDVFGVFKLARTFEVEK